MSSLIHHCFFRRKIIIQELLFNDLYSNVLNLWIKYFLEIYGRFWISFFPDAGIPKYSIRRQKHKYIHSLNNLTSHPVYECRTIILYFSQSQAICCWIPGVWKASSQRKGEVHILQPPLRNLLVTAFRKMEEQSLKQGNIGAWKLLILSTCVKIVKFPEIADLP